MNKVRLICVGAGIGIVLAGWWSEMGLHATYMALIGLGVLFLIGAEYAIHCIRMDIKRPNGFWRGRLPEDDK